MMSPQNKQLLFFFNRARLNAANVAEERMD